MLDLADTVTIVTIIIIFVIIIIIIVTSIIIFIIAIIIVFHQNTSVTMEDQSICIEINLLIFFFFY